MLKIYCLTNKSIKKKNIHVPFLYVITFKKNMPRINTVTSRGG